MTTDTETSEVSAELSEEDLKRRLLSRIAIAAVVVVGLLGSLAMFDAIYAPSKPTPARITKVEPPPEPPKEAAKPVEAPPPEAAKEEAKPAEQAATPATTPAPEAPKEAAKPEVKSEPKVAVKAEPEGTRSPGAPPLLPSPKEKPLTKPATARPATMHPSAAAVPPATAPAAKPDAAREVARATAPRHAPVTKPLTQATERNFALQMGVFNNLANAEDLRAKLEMHGIPTTIEARVHVGPFKTREEAEAAREKLKALGMDGGMLLTLKK